MLHATPQQKQSEQRQIWVSCALLGLVQGATASIVVLRGDHGMKYQMPARIHLAPKPVHTTVVALVWILAIH